VRAITGAACVLILTPLGGCGPGVSGSDERTLTVFAAASLASAFTELADEFEDEHPDVDVRVSFSGSSGLAAQIVEGAPADVFAAADERTMAVVEDAEATGGSPVVFATNTLQIVVGRDGPGVVRSVEDIGDPDARVVLCAPQVPCGAAARTALGAAGVEVDPVSEEQSVSDVLGKVAAGEADAGLVYRTDVLAAADRVEGVDLPTEAQVVNRYPLVALDGAVDAALAAEFVAFIAGDDARATLAAAGFGAP
jgi:molybdate transport system substrate-binding protein